MPTPRLPLQNRNAPATAIHRHPNFYFDDGNILLLVEPVLYRLHRSILSRHSNVFLDMLGQGEGSEEGKNDENPVRLSSVTNEEFERLLWLAYYPR
jgi:hypothetical protein